jgi:hypothetical protein
MKNLFAIIGVMVVAEKGYEFVRDEIGAGPTCF